MPRGWMRIRRQKRVGHWRGSGSEGGRFSLRSFGGLRRAKSGIPFPVENWRCEQYFTSRRALCTLDSFIAADRGDAGDSHGATPD